MNDNMVLEEWFDRITPTDKVLELLLPAAARALAQENARLQAAFELSPRLSERPSSERRSRSLAHPVFETTLAYEIFKAWLPYVDVEWEVSYPGYPAGKADLVLYEGGGTSRVFECKWWMNTGVRYQAALESDIRKLSSWRNARHYLLTFWHSPADERSLAADREDVKGFRGDQRKPLWWAHFPIHYISDRPHYFALAALQVP